MERKGLVTFKGTPLTLTGNEVKVGDKAPAFTVLDKDLNAVSLSEFSGKIKFISVTPSLDTPVCHLQEATFNHKIQRLSDDVVALNMSMDLPFAIARLYASEESARLRKLSDHRDASFGTGYDVLIKELRLLARSVFVIDKTDVVRYIQIVPETTDEPDYDKAMAEVEKLVS